jgi:hypothetical protein
MESTGVIGKRTKMVRACAPPLLQRHQCTTHFLTGGATPSVPLPHTRSLTRRLPLTGSPGVLGWRATAEEREETAEETAEGYTEGGHLSKARWEVC